MSQSSISGTANLARSRCFPTSSLIWWTWMRLCVRVWLVPPTLTTKFCRILSTNLAVSSMTYTKTQCRNTREIGKPHPTQYLPTRELSWSLLKSSASVSSSRPSNATVFTIGVKSLWAYGYGHHCEASPGCLLIEVLLEAFYSVALWRKQGQIIKRKSGIGTRVQ